MQKSRHSERRPASVRPQADTPPPDERPSASHSSADAATRRVTAVRLTRKYADMIDGVDLTEANVGDELNLTPREADVLVAEGWAERAPTSRRRASDVRSVAAEAPRPRRRHKR